MGTCLPSKVRKGGTNSMNSDSGSLRKQQKKQTNSPPANRVSVRSTLLQTEIQEQQQYVLKLQRGKLSKTKKE